MKSLLGLGLALLAAGCTQTAEPGSAHVVIQAASASVPDNGQCVHVIATRTSDFEVSEYFGPLDGAVLATSPGEHRLSATAFGPSCGSEPGAPPWRADDLVATFGAGSNSVTLVFRSTVDVDITATFDDGTDHTLVIHEETRVRTGRSGEGAAGPGYSLDGWDVKRIAIPPEAPSETVLFSLLGRSAMPDSPRGIAAFLDGSFAFQVSDPHAPLFLFDAAGNPTGELPTSYAPGQIQWDLTDGLSAIDATHLVRTGWLNSPIGCDDAGAGCVESGIEILEIQGDGVAHVIQQLTLPETTGEQLNLEYPVGVAAIPGGYAVTTIPDTDSRLVLLDTAGNLTVGPVLVPGDIEGLFADGTRLVTVGYTGQVSAYDLADLAPRVGESTFYHVGVDFASGVGIAFDAATSQNIVLDGNGAFFAANAGFTSLAPLGLVTGMFLPRGFDIKPDSHELAVMDRRPPLVAGVRTATVQLFDLGTLLPTTSFTLDGVPANVRPWALAWIGASNQVVSIHRRVGGVPDPSLDAIAYVNTLGGASNGTIDLRASVHATRIASVTYLPNTDELLFHYFDDMGTPRLVVTDRAGTPRRGYRTDALPNLIDFAALPSGDVIAEVSQPSDVVTVSLP